MPGRYDPTEACEEGVAGCQKGEVVKKIKKVRNNKMDRNLSAISQKYSLTSL